MSTFIAITEVEVTPNQPVEPRVGCISNAMQVIGSKWTALILRDLMDGPRRFCQLQSSVDGINPRTLSQRLDELEKQGIVTRTTYNEMPPRTDYCLTAKGFELLPILQQMAAWGDKYPEC